MCGGPTIFQAVREEEWPPRQDPAYIEEILSFPWTDRRQRHYQDDVIAVRSGTHTQFVDEVPDLPVPYHCGLSPDAHDWFKDGHGPILASFDVHGVADLYAPESMASTDPNYGVLGGVQKLRDERQFIPSYNRQCMIDLARLASA